MSRPTGPPTPAAASARAVTDNSSLDPHLRSYADHAQDTAQNTTQPGDHVNTQPTTGEQITEQITAETDQQPMCPCHDAVDCPDQATVTINAAELARLGGLLTDIDEFLRCGNGVAELLADFYATHRGHPHPRLAAATLIDLVGFTIPALHRTHHTVAAGNHRSGDRR